MWINTLTDLTLSTVGVPKRALFGFGVTTLDVWGLINRVPLTCASGRCRVEERRHSEEIEVFSKRTSDKRTLCKITSPEAGNEHDAVTLRS